MSVLRRLAPWLVGLVLVNALLLFMGRSQGQKHAVDTHRMRIGLVLDVGGLGDKSFNDSAYAGLTRAAAEFDVETRLVEPGDGADRESALRDLAASGFDLVIGVGFIFTQDVREAAALFPKSHFACIDYSVIPGDSPPPPNLAGLRFREHEGSFLVGALAGLTSKTHKVGFVGGMEIPLIRKFEAGYRAGVRAVCPDCDVFGAYAGTEPKAFADPSRGRELALAQYAQGADVIFHAAGKTGTGVFGAARAKNMLAIGVDSDQFHEAPCCVLSSMVKGVDVAVYDAIRSVVEDRFVGGIREFGLAEGGVDYVYDHRNQKWIPAAVREKLEALRADIIAGKIHVPAE